MVINRVPKWYNPGFLQPGNSRSCVGYAWRSALMMIPKHPCSGRKLPSGGKIYSRIIDRGMAGQVGGAPIKEGGVVLESMGLIDTYHRFIHPNEIKGWLILRGPLVVGVRWTVADSMCVGSHWVPSAWGDGGMGHALTIAGYDSTTGRVLVTPNLEGGVVPWGRRGFAWVDLDELMNIKMSAFYGFVNADTCVVKGSWLGRLWKRLWGKK